MAARKARTDAEKERAQDKRLQSKYGISLADRNQRLEQQNYKCKICGNPADAYGHPAVDHFHFPIKTFRLPPTDPAWPEFKWYALAYDETWMVVCEWKAKTKAEAHALVKQNIMPWSVRGILCFKCNRGLGAIERFFDAARHPENLLPVIEYFRARLPNSLDRSTSTAVLLPVCQTHLLPPSNEISSGSELTF